MNKECYTKKKIVNAPRSNTRHGSFALVYDEREIVQPNGRRGIRLESGDWVYCRDSWQRSYAATMNNMLFYHETKKGKNVAYFLRNFEKRMKHSLFTEMGPTNLVNISWVKPAEFWMRSPIRRSLFTVLLRAGVFYNVKSNNFRETIINNDYLENTIQAVEWFLSGHTWYVGDAGSGWHDRFRNLGLEDIKQILTYRPISNDQLFSFALKKLGITKSKLMADYRKTNHPISRSNSRPKLEEN